jgi:succinyl-diaminopimelate desuccinylase
MRQYHETATNDLYKAQINQLLYPMNPTIVSPAQAITNYLEQLVRMPTISNDLATNTAALDWVEQQLSGLPLTIQRLTNQGFPALIATTNAVKNPKNPRLWLAAHMDVVSGTHEDFTPRVANGIFYGRGTHDMKFAIAIYIALLKSLGRNLEHYDIGLFLTCDEEIGGINGARWLVEDLGYRGEAVLLPDTSANWKAEMGGKGIMWWQIDAVGKTTHASRPWEGVNAIDELVGFVNHVRNNCPKEPCGDHSHNHATVNFSTIEAGGSVNQVPASASAKLDIRFTPDMDFETVARWMEAARIAYPSVTPTLQRHDYPYKVQPNKAGELFESIVQDVTGIEVTRYTSHGSADARFFAWKNVPVINVGVAGSGYHVSPEWVNIDDLLNFFEITSRFVDQWAKN